MANHRALIVDDSKTAQHRLKRMLNKYDLDIDMSNSAEEALGYLTHTMPSVIFMDHHMEGMDGLEALKIIKANPSTAVIPVIMYTSQSGDVYVGRAHALGALDILSKEVIKAANIDAVLAKLKIQISDGEAAEFALQNKEQADQKTDQESAIDHDEHHAEQEQVISQDDEIDEDVVIHSPLSQDDPTDLKKQVARLFELHIADVRTQITENTKFMIRRLTSEIKTATTENQKEEKAEPEDIDGKGVDTPAGLFLYPILLILILLGVIFVAFKLIQLDKNHLNSELLFQEIESIKSQIPNYQSTSETIPGSEYFAESNSYDNYEILEAISVASNLETEFGYQKSPFDDENLAVMLTLIETLDISGFKGMIEISIHTGNFCVVADAAGEWMLATEAALIGACTFSKTQPNTSLEEWTNDAYEQLEVLAVPLQQGDIELIFVAREEEPKKAYPEQVATLKAGDWNSIATQNNYLTLRLESEE